MEELDALSSDRTSSASSDQSDDEKHDEDEPIGNDKERGLWANQMEFLLAIVGYTVGVANVWRFPIICARNGGGAFLIPFFFFLFTSGGPLYYMEVCLGQFTGKSAILAFEFCPLVKGLGLLQVSLSALVVWYLIVVFAWVLYFLYSSFFPSLPWATCDNWWNTPQCAGPGSLNTTYSYMVTNGNQTVSNATEMVQNSSLKRTSPAFEFWQYNVLRKSDGLEDMGHIQPHLAICLFFSWTLVVLVLVKGVRSIGKVVYVTAILPYVFLTILLVRGLLLDGAVDGVIYYLTPDFGKLANIQVWLEAAVQVFFSLGPSWGSVITMASYNKFHQQSLRPTVICVVAAGFTAFFNGLVVFTLIGVTAKEAGMTIQEAASTSGAGLAFIAFPTALSYMQLPQLWSVLFFLMLVTVVFDSMFGMMEAVTSAVIDFFPAKLTRHRALVNISVGLVFFVTGLPLTMNGGVYLFLLSDWYFSQFALLIGSSLECVAVCWIYGTDRFSRDIAAMTGRDVSVLLRVFWGLLIPLFILITFIVLLTKYSAPSYGGTYQYSESAIAVGIMCGMVPIVLLLAWGVLGILKTDGSLYTRLVTQLRPSKHWVPNNYLQRESYRVEPYRYEATLRERIRVNILGPKHTPFL